MGKQNGKGTLNVNSSSTFTTNGEIRVAFSDGNGTFNGWFNTSDDNGSSNGWGNASDGNGNYNN